MSLKRLMNVDKFINQFQRHECPKQKEARTDWISIIFDRSTKSFASNSAIKSGLFHRAKDELGGHPFGDA